MPSSNPRSRFEDIIGEIDFVTSATAGMSFESFVADATIRRAVERAYAIISEAAVKLGDEAETLAPEIPWHDVRGIGDRIRHEYGNIDFQTLWTIRCDDLSPLRTACVKALTQLAAPEAPSNGNGKGEPKPD